MNPKRSIKRFQNLAFKNTKPTEVTGIPRVRLKLKYFHLRI
ncbi:hypothetical protein HMPREF9104_01555 [Lentilactobacillus kisonensis F0435]|uniref:Uncharacterized protein n=1 Tax=Lentilactobacillus kisonensis F0435 TaxID=797516 RepID=H1LG29_9LACO|nr:hypothetical protein HMPREF9104_01555 [Lentilactobacillus kisonensis F0435]